ncbi:LysR substrate-binding domain-containing protein [Burkholderia sp. FERM BP-3421]|uniref:LysR substrate-binding domain-containing protein n=1 Tax=Burkholderia sp. FERM BP-3421 TaxID=1494466 RepID=UPI0023629139|nr:LysR substrate-binding domain-containing protein [Burkholderia sp. FERM BP-3421]WDD95589.1 LysR substrate-binding domain-containing protein [Burkholderia sp. FERM BP-3421]
MAELPPLAAIRTFLVACRAGSFSAAADELCVTHSAVSRQIQTLESRLGLRLFEKDGQRMVPTVHARAFAQELDGAFDALTDIVERYGKGRARQVLRVSVPTTFGMRWLIPRLVTFRVDHPDATIQVLTVTTQQQPNGGHCDVAIRREDLLFNPASAVRFLSDHHTVIASPSLLAERPLRHPADLIDHTLLETETRPRHWDDWFAAAQLDGQRFANRLRFDHFHVTFQGVVDELGVGIGPVVTLSRDIASGRIVAPFDAIRVAHHDYYAITPIGIQKTVLHRRFEDWLVANGAA